MARSVDQASAALVKDLRQRGLLDDTLVIWGGEFGRTSYSQGKLTKTSYGRDHHPRCFTMWMAGGGTRAGSVYGETDDFGYNIARSPVHVHDFQATLLHLLGLDHERLTFKLPGAPLPAHRRARAGREGAARMTPRTTVATSSARRSSVGRRCWRPGFRVHVPSRHGRLTAEVIGHGGFRYRAEPGWAGLDPARTPVNNCHEMVMDRRGRLFMTTDEPRNNVVVFDTGGRLLGSWSVDCPGAHGLTIWDAGGEEFLFVTDPGAGRRS